MKLKQIKRNEAEARNTAYNVLSPAARLIRLDTKLGVGVGAERERARLARLLKAKAAKPVVKKAAGR